MYLINLTSLTCFINYESEFLKVISLFDKRVLLKEDKGIWKCVSES